MADKPVNTTFDYKIVLTDLLVLSLLFLIPSISHILPIPLYLFDPMRIIVFICIILSKNIKNVLIISLTIPIFSSLITGHPVFAKSVLISMELFSNIFLLSILIKNNKVNKLLLFFTALLASKCIYYLLKYLFIQLNIIEGELIITPLHIQLYTAIGIALLYFIFIKNEHLQKP